MISKAKALGFSRLLLPIFFCSHSPSANRDAVTGQPQSPSHFLWHNSNFFFVILVKQLYSHGLIGCVFVYHSAFLWFLWGKPRWRLSCIINQVLLNDGAFCIVEMQFSLVVAHPHSALCSWVASPFLTRGNWWQCQTRHVFVYMTTRSRLWLVNVIWFQQQRIASRFYSLWCGTFSSARSLTS